MVTVRNAGHLGTLPSRHTTISVCRCGTKLWEDVECADLGLCRPGLVPLWEYVRPDDSNGAWPRMFIEGKADGGWLFAVGDWRRRAVGGGGGRWDVHIH